MGLSRKQGFCGSKIRKRFRDFESRALGIFEICYQQKPTPSLSLSLSLSNQTQTRLETNKVPFVSILSCFKFGKTHFELSVILLFFIFRLYNFILRHCIFILLFLYRFRPS